MNKLKSLGIIMDGNRRHARVRGLPEFEGHRRGYEKVGELLGWVENTEIKTLYPYAFSSENWQRAAGEVSFLLDLFRIFLDKETAKLVKKGVKLVLVGEQKKFPPDFQSKMTKAMQDTKQGGRSEIVAAAKDFARQYGDKFKRVGEKEFESCLWTAGLPDPDLIIRTGGDERLSNFLTWKSVYSELYLTKTFWPELTRQEFESIIRNYETRERRYGR